MKIEISNGELVDKITILLIKLNKIDHIKDSQKWDNVRNELDAIEDKIYEIHIKKDNRLYNELYDVNNVLWNIEDRIRIKEKNKEFDQEFIDLARSVYYNNDKRARIKKEINKLTKSELTEEKSYEQY